jgi:hypothetical protein
LGIKKINKKSLPEIEKEIERENFNYLYELNINEISHL